MGFNCFSAGPRWQVRVFVVVCLFFCVSYGRVWLMFLKLLCRKIKLFGDIEIVQSFLPTDRQFLVVDKIGKFLA